MKRRFVSILMALVMALSLLPAQALAEDNTVTELNKNNISTYVTNGLGNGTYKLSDDVEITSTLTITGDTTLDLNNHVLQMTGNGSVFKIESTGRLTLEDNAATKTQKYFDRNDTTGLWSWRTDNSTSAYSVSGGVITGGSAHQGGGVYIGGGTFAMTGGSIVGCAATHTSLAAWGGGVFVLGGQFNMTGGNIVGCTAVTQGGDVAHGGGVCISMGTFNMSGGSITDCTAAAQGADGIAWGGGICNYRNGITTLSGTAKIQNCHATGNKCYGGGICDSGKLNISGNVQIIGCTAGGQGSDAMYINANNGSSVTGGTFYGGISGSGTISGHIVTYQVNGADYATQVVPSGETATQPADPTVPADQTFDGWYKADGTKWNFTNDTVTENITLTGWLYAPVKDETEFTAALADNSIDVIRLTNDINITSTVEIKSSRQVTLDLNDHVLQMTGRGCVFGVYTKGCLTLEDNAATKTPKYFDRNDTTGLWSWRTDNSTSAYSVSGGVITGGSTASNHSGGAIVVTSSSTVIMNGGSIVGCSAGVGGGAVLMNGGKFEMNSGAIIGCTANDNGGGVSVLNGTFTMTNGSISDCTAGNGEAICLRGGTMNANGGTVDGTVVLESRGSIQGSGTNATEFNGTVTNKGTISRGTFNDAVENTGTITGGTYNDLIINKSANTTFNGVHSPLGIIENKPGTGSSTYHTVTFAPAESDMEHTTRYFLNGGKISSEIKPASRTGYAFGGWYKADGTAWDHTTDTVTGDLTLTAHWTACDHANSENKPTCTTGATCTVCGGTIEKLGHDWGAWTSNGNDTHTRVCSRDASHTETDNCSGGTATCTAKAVCTVCGGEYGEMAAHNFTAEIAEADYLKSAATCTEKAVYYKSCAVCGLSSKGTPDEATFFSGNALGHDWGDWTPSSNKTHTRTCKTDSTHTETKNCADDNKDHVCDTCGATLTQHSGGTASCAAPATCGYCGKPYGEKNPANHSDLKHVPAKAATTQAEGNSEYWLCSGCGKCYKDAAAATEIALSDTVIAKRIPRRYSGPTITVMGAAYYDGGNVGLTFVSSADFDTFTGVQVDGKTLAAKNYIAERGSIEVYLKAVYLRTLKNGSHTVTIQSTAGDVSAVFTVENSKTSPGTSDPGVAVYALSSMLSLTGLAALRRRKED